MCESSTVSLKLLLLLLQLSLIESQSTSDSCSTDTEPLISGGRYKVHDQFFSADSSSANRFSPQQSRLNGRSWCSSNNLNSQSETWLQIIFGTDVILHQIKTGGYDNVLDNLNPFAEDHYVISFQVFVGNVTGQLQPLLQPNSSQPMVFERTETRGVVTTDLPFPVTTQVLRIVPVRWTPSNQVCLKVEAIGCLSMPTCMNQAFLSGNPELLGPGSITASSAMDDDPAEDVIDSGNDAWCTNEAFQSGPAPYIQLNFTKTLSLTYMRARGGMLGFSYVTEFKVEIEDDEGNFIAYGITGPPPTRFTTRTSGKEVYTFWRPVHGRVFRFNIINGVRNQINMEDDFCWNIELYGCLNNGSIPANSPTSPIDANPPTSPIDANTDGTDLTTTEGKVVDAAPLAGAIAGAVVGGLIVIVLLLILLILVMLLISWNRRKRVKARAPYDNVTRTVDNTIYGEEMKSPSSDQDTDPYDVTRTVQGCYYPADALLPSKPTDRTYESIDDTYESLDNKPQEYAYIDSKFTAHVRFPSPVGMKPQQKEGTESEEVLKPDSNGGQEIVQTSTKTQVDTSLMEKTELESLLTDNPLYGKQLI